MSVFGLLIDQEMKLHLSEVIAADGLSGGQCGRSGVNAKHVQKCLGRLTESCLHFFRRKKQEKKGGDREKKVWRRNLSREKK